jgi:hypothetical protein
MKIKKTMNEVSTPKGEKIDKKERLGDKGLESAGYWVMASSQWIPICSCVAGWKLPTTPTEDSPTTHFLSQKRI